MFQRVYTLPELLAALNGNHHVEDSKLFSTLIALLEESKKQSERILALEKIAVKENINA
jgi:hypothetical protein